MASSRRIRVAFLACLLMAGSATATAHESARVPAEDAEAVGDDSGLEEHPALPEWLEPPEETPIADSVEPAVERFLRERLPSCSAAADGVPCFPVAIEVQGRRYSVRESLENLELDDRPAPGPPTAAEIVQQGANPRPPSAGVGFDPKAVVCKTKQLLGRIQGRSETYYLYRVWDETGERALLRDRPLDPETLARAPEFRYLLLGEYGDECEAIEAYRRSTYEVRMRRGGDDPERGREPSVAPRPIEEPD